MQHNLVVFNVFLIFFGATLIATFALFTRQSLLVAYILLGIVFGPSGLELVSDPTLVEEVGTIGIIFLLFLLGLHLQPQSLLLMLRKVTWVSLISSILFGLLGFGVGHLFGFTINESLIIGTTMMFSSTIIGLKLLPTTVMHHQHTGGIMIGILLMQDLIAIVVLLVLQGASDRAFSWADLAAIIIGMPLLLAGAVVVSKFILVKLIARFDHTKEYIFLLAIAWCLAISQLAAFIGLSEEIGAFIAGVSLAANPVAFSIAEDLRPLRDFFLVMFFFSIGADFDVTDLKTVMIPAGLLTLAMLVFKPLVFELLLRNSGEKKPIAREVGVRLGQASEFSLLVAALASETFLIGEEADLLIRTATVLTFIISSYLVVILYRTPAALVPDMQRD